MGYGIADETVQGYVNGLRHGQVLLAVQAPDLRQDELQALLREYGGRNVVTHYG